QLDPQYQAALEFEEMRLRRELEIQQDLDFRRRLVEELEYRQQLQQLQNLQSQQTQQNTLNELLAHSNLLGLQQQYSAGRESDLLSSLQDEYLLQRHHQLMMQDQMQQRLMAAELAQAHSHDQFDAGSPVLAMLNASRNNTYGPYFDEESLRNRELLDRISSEQPHLATAPSNNVALMEQARNSSRQGLSSTPIDNAVHPCPKPKFSDTHVSQTKMNAVPTKNKKSYETEANDFHKVGVKPAKKVKTISTDNGNVKLKSPKSKTKTTSSKTSPFLPATAPTTVCHSSEGVALPVSDQELKPRAFSSEGGVELVSEPNSHNCSVLDVTESSQKPEAGMLDNRHEPDVVKLSNDKKLTSGKKSEKQKDGGINEKKDAKKKGKASDGNESVFPKLRRKKRTSDQQEKESKPIQEITKSGKLDGRTKKARALKKQVLAEQRLLTDQEKTVINFLSGHTSDELEKTPTEANDGRPKKKKNENNKKKDESESDNEFAASIVLKFRDSDIPASDIKIVNAWSKKDSHCHRIPSIPESEYPYLTPNLKFNLPLLPVEPEFVDTETVDINAISLAEDVNSLIKASDILGTSDSVSLRTDHSPGDTQTGRNPTDIEKSKTTNAEKWWPTDASIQQEIELLGHETLFRSELLGHETKEDTAGVQNIGGGICFTEKSLIDAKKRMESSVEPGVLELLPHCKLYEKLVSKNMASGQSEVTDGPKFCFQVAEVFPDEVMVCCSECSTWRHAQCGGHYKHYSRFSADPSNIVFKPLCDRCFLEQDLIKNNELAAKRIDMQRLEHLRRCNATNDVMRQAAFSRHSQSKWPLGSVSPAHFVGHTRGVQARHEKAEKLWEEIVMKLSSGKERSKDRIRLRTRALERLLLSVEDAENMTDIHNMILFLQNDTSKDHPVGFETFRRNIFDPEDDPVSVVVEDHKSELTFSNRSTLSSDDLDKDSELQGEAALMATDLGTMSNKSNLSTKMRGEKYAGHEESLHCVRKGCLQKPRFDSIFCSDSCGVSTLEMDLLHSLKYAQDIHPSVLRS
ncbi:hypothetical protein ACHAW6_008011, partial [Cyclotella cf. meneghiniana]